ncbi:enoyl-CoA hydratase [Acuticoccus sp.]|uniref:enoyl-CoA hydratase n=1 Tax=Acuticoccus sp. TaxID=1904378 RepID=UPI003B51D128
MTGDPTTREPAVRLSVDRRAEGAVAQITVDNVRKLNVLDPALAAALVDRIAEAARIADLRAVVVTGAGERAFIGGADIGAMAGFGPAAAHDFITSLHKVCEGLRRMPVPVIARVNGWALGGGLEVAAACDMRVATDAAGFGMPEVRVGIPSVIEAALLPGLIGWGRTRELLLTGRSFDAAEALAIGMVERVVPADALDDAVEEWLSGILASGPRAIRQQKALIGRWEALPLDEAIAAGIDAFADAYETDEPVRMMRAFIDRRRR